MRSVTLIVGPPCAGKTTYAREHATPDDLVIDWDELAINAGSPFAHDHPAEFRGAATRERQKLEQHVTNTDDITAFVIRTLPSLADQHDVADRLRATNIVVLDTPMDVCLLRARDTGRPAEVDEVIVRWHATRAGARQYAKTDKPAGYVDPRKTSAWKNVSAVVRKQGGRCHICGRGIRYDLRAPHPLSFSVDHITAIANGGAWFDLNNLAPAHLGCNSAKGARNDAPLHRTSQAW